MAIDQLKERLKFEKNKSNKENVSNNSSKTLTIKDKVIEEIKKIYDPEIPVNIYELGLIYDIAVDKKNISVKMTLTSPNCPVAESLPKEVKDSIMQLEEVDKVDLDLVWEPPWDKSMMSEAAKLELNL
jgi:FeS assembly SUF system protein